MKKRNKVVSRFSKNNLIIVGLVLAVIVVAVASVKTPLLAPDVGGGEIGENGCPILVDCMKDNIQGSGYDSAGNSGLSGSHNAKIDCEKNIDKAIEECVNKENKIQKNICIRIEDCNYDVNIIRSPCKITNVKRLLLFGTHYTAEGFLHMENLCSK
jgi:hypothetical protein